MKARGKTFLSESAYEGASISWYVRTREVGLYEMTLSASISLRDCSDQIHLGFDCTEYKHVKKRVAKLDVLMLQLTEMRKALLEAEKELAPKKYYY